MPSTDPQTALEEFERLAAAADVSTDVSKMDPEDQEEHEDVKGVLTKAIMGGLLSVDTDGCAVMATGAGDVTFRVPRGGDLMIIASANENKRMEAMSRFVCALTGKDTRFIEKLSKREWKLAMRLAGFLSAD